MIATTLAILFIVIILRLILNNSPLERIRIITGLNKIDYAISSNIGILFLGLLFLTLFTLKISINIDIFTIFSLVVSLLFTSLIFGLRRILVGKSKLSNKSHSDLSKWGASMFFHCLLFCVLQFLLVFYLFK